MKENEPKLGIWDEKEQATIVMITKIISKPELGWVYYYDNGKRKSQETGEYVEEAQFCGKCGKEFSFTFPKWHKRICTDCYEKKEENDPAEDKITKQCEHCGGEIKPYDVIMCEYCWDAPVTRKKYKWRNANEWYDALPDTYKGGQSESTLKALFHMARKVI